MGPIDGVVEGPDSNRVPLHFFGSGFATVAGSLATVRRRGRGEYGILLPVGPPRPLQTMTLNIPLPTPTDTELEAAKNALLRVAELLDWVPFGTLAQHGLVDVAVILDKWAAGLR